MNDADKRVAADPLFKRLLSNWTSDAGFQYAQLETELGDYEAAIGALSASLYNPNLPRAKLQQTCSISICVRMRWRAIISTP